MANYRELEHRKNDEKQRHFVSLDIEKKVCGRREGWESKERETQPYNGNCGAIKMEMIVMKHNKKKKKKNERERVVVV